MERVFQSWELNRQPLRWGKHLNNTHLTLKHESKSWHGDDCTEIMSLKPKKTEGNAIIKNARPLLDILIIFERNLNLKQTHFFLKRFPMYITATCRENFDKSRFRVTEHNADISYHQSQVHGSLQIDISGPKSSTSIVHEVSGLFKFDLPIALGIVSCAYQYEVTKIILFELIRGGESKWRFLFFFEHFTTTLPTHDKTRFNCLNMCCVGFWTCVEHIVQSLCNMCLFYCSFITINLVIHTCRCSINKSDHMRITYRL